MSSLELVSFINSQRGDGESELLHTHFLQKVSKVLGGGETKFRSTYLSSQNKELPCYNFPKREACLMAMSYSYDLQAKVFDRMTELEGKQQPALPQTYKEALLALVEKVDAIEKLEAQATIDKPKALFADSVACADTTILIGELAKILKGNGVDVGQNRIFDLLRKDGYLISRKGSDTNMPTQKSMELGLFKIKETVISHSEGHTTINKTPKITGKGQIYFVNKYKKPHCA